MFPQRSAELRSSRRLSEQKQRSPNEKGSLPGTGSYVRSALGNPVTEQVDRALDIVLNVKDYRKKAPTTRPPNAFMLFRSDFWAREKLKVKPIERDHRDISRIAAICWNNLDDETKAVYRKRADEHKELHRLQHPEYRYSPVPHNTTRTKRKQARKGESADEERCKRLAVRAMTERDFKLIETGTKDVFTVQENGPTLVSPKEEDCRTNVQALIADTSEPQFTQKLRLEKYILELRFWHTAAKLQQDTDIPVINDRNTEWVPRDTGSLGRVNKLPSPLVGEEADLFELDQYFQFDKYNEN